MAHRVGAQQPHQFVLVELDAGVVRKVVVHDERAHLQKSVASRLREIVPAKGNKIVGVSQPRQYSGMQITVHVKCTNLNPSQVGRPRPDIGERALRHVRVHVELLQEIERQCVLDAVGMDLKS